MTKVLNFKNIIEEVKVGSLATWTAAKGFEWELYFNTDEEFEGVCIDNLTDKQIKRLEDDCINSKGFYSPDFADTNLNEYDLIEEL